MVPAMRKVILLAEDNQFDSDLVQMALSECGSKNRLEIVKDGEEAIQFLFQRGKHADAPRPNLVILDWNLPKLNGMEVLQEVRSYAPLQNVPFVIFSGGQFSRASERFLGDNLAIQLNKPATVDEFFRAIQVIDGYVARASKTRPKEDSDLWPLRQLFVA